MTTGERFTDSVIAALSQDAEVLAAMDAPVWDAERNILLVRIDPKDQNAARELAERAVELIRGIRDEKFRAEVQHLNVEDKLIYVFKLTLDEKHPQPTQ